MSLNYNEIGKNIREVRKENGLLHTALAGGSWCGAERQRGGGSGSVLM